MNLHVCQMYRRSKWKRLSVLNHVHTSRLSPCILISVIKVLCNYKGLFKPLWYLSTALLICNLLRILQIPRPPPKYLIQTSETQKATKRWGGTKIHPTSSQTIYLCFAFRRGLQLLGWKSQQPINTEHRGFWRPSPARRFRGPASPPVRRKNLSLPTISGC